MAIFKAEGDRPACGMPATKVLGGPLMGLWPRSEAFGPGMPVSGAVICTSSVGAKAPPAVAGGNAGEVDVFIPGRQWIMC